MATPGLDPTILQTALLQVAEATKAASDAAKAVAAQQQKGSSAATAPSANVGWSKLVNRPPVFEHATTEAEITGFRDWSWQVSQYLSQLMPITMRR